MVYVIMLIGICLVSYNGQKRVFTIEIGGFKILSMIDKEKQEEKTCIRRYCYYNRIKNKIQVITISICNL